MAIDTNEGKTPTTAEQMEASNAMMHAESAAQAAENQLRAATDAAGRIQAQKAVQAAGEEMDQVKEKYGWIFDWQKGAHDMPAAAASPSTLMGGMAETAKKVTLAEAEAMLRDAKTAEERLQAEKLVRMASDDAAAKPAMAQVKKHIVQRGESLSLIAKQYTGDAQKWKELYEANKAVVGSNPNIIQPGIELVLPW